MKKIKGVTESKRKLKNHVSERIDIRAVEDSSKTSNIYSPWGSAVRMLWFQLFCSGVKNSIPIQTPTELSVIDLVSWMPTAWLKKGQGT